jgi:hypothetical protein
MIRIQKEKILSMRITSIVIRMIANIIKSEKP